MHFCTGRLATAGLFSHSYFFLVTIAEVRATSLTTGPTTLDANFLPPSDQFIIPWVIDLEAQDTILADKARISVRNSLLNLLASPAKDNPVSN